MFKVVGWSVMSCATNLKIKSRPKFQYHPSIPHHIHHRDLTVHLQALASPVGYPTNFTVRLQDCKTARAEGACMQEVLKPLNLQLQNHPLPTTQFIFKS